MIWVDLATVFSTTFVPILTGYALDNTILGIPGKKKISNPTIRKIILGLVFFIILFLIGKLLFLPEISGKLNPELQVIIELVKNGLIPYVVLVQMLCLVFAFIIMTIQSIVEHYLSKKGASDARRRPLFHQ